MSADMGGDERITVKRMIRIIKLANEEEKLIGVPLDAATKAALEARAAENGRAMVREAAMIIRRELAAGKAAAR